jgi:ubiquinone/menaquinone biosynthesis C-methylase UbiE
LRKQGIHPEHLRPFEEVEKYIAFLERSDRAEWQKPDEVVSALGLKQTETVVDLGAGSGYFSFRFAKSVPKGKVVAADTEAEMIRHIHHRAMRDDVRNLEPKLIKPDEPAIPPEADLVFICDVLHHVQDRGSWLSKIAGGMKSGARLALIEFKEGHLPAGPPENLKVPRAELLRLCTESLSVDNGQISEPSDPRSLRQAPHARNSPPESNTVPGSVCEMTMPSFINRFG